MPVDNPTAEALLRARAPRALRPLTGRERLSEALFALGLVGATAALYVLGGWWSTALWVPARHAAGAARRPRRHARARQAHRVPHRRRDGAADPARRRADAPPAAAGDGAG